jgi:hypothetical protein
MDDMTDSTQEGTTILPESASLQELEKRQRRIVIAIIAIAVVIMIVLIASFVFLMQARASSVAQLRDVFIIFLALQSLLIGLVLVILMIQLATLINLLQNEIKPILDSTNETVSNLRGTTNFLSDNLVQPVIRLNEQMAGMMRFLAIMGLTRRPKKSQSNTKESNL